MTFVEEKTFHNNKQSECLILLSNLWFLFNNLLILFNNMPAVPLSVCRGGAPPTCEAHGSVRGGSTAGSHHWESGSWPAPRLPWWQFAGTKTQMSGVCWRHTNYMCQMLHLIIQVVILYSTHTHTYIYIFIHISTVNLPSLL